MSMGLFRNIERTSPEVFACVLQDDFENCLVEGNAEFLNGSCANASARLDVIVACTGEVCGIEDLECNDIFNETEIDLYYLSYYEGCEIDFDQNCNDILSAIADDEVEDEEEDENSAGFLTRISSVGILTVVALNY